MPKINQTALRIIRLFNFLLEKEQSLEQISSFLNDECSYETILKYINTIKLGGYNIIKNDGKYKIENFKLFKNNEKGHPDKIKSIQQFVLSLNNTNCTNSFNEIFEKSQKYFFKDSKFTKLEPKEYEHPYLRYREEINKYSSYIKDDLRLKIIYKGKNYLVEPISIKYLKGCVGLECFNTKSYQKEFFILDNILCVVQTPSKSTYNNFGQTVTFKIRGELSKAYKLKTGEKIIEENKDSMVIVNTFESKELLFKRILKYGKNAEILFPQEGREAFKEIVERTLKLYQG